MYTLLARELFFRACGIFLGLSFLGALSLFFKEREREGKVIFAEGRGESASVFETSARRVIFLASVHFKRGCE